MKWTDRCKIAKDLAEAYPDIDPASIHESDLQTSILHLHSSLHYPNPSYLCRTQLKSIQNAWIEENKTWHIDI
jgi:FeS assembly protein IscX